MTTMEVGGGGKLETAARSIEDQFGGLFRSIRIIDFESDVCRARAGREDKQGMIDSQAGKANHVDHRRAMLLDGFEQFPRDPGLRTA